LFSYKDSLDIARENIINKYPYFNNILSNIDNLVYSYHCQCSLALVNNYSKSSYMTKSKYSLSYLKIGLPIFLGYKKDILNHPIVSTDNINWQDLQDFLMTLCLIHQIQNNDKLIKLISINDANSDTKLNTINNPKPYPIQEKNQILKSFYQKAKSDLQSLNLSEKQITTLDNLLSWAYDYKDSTYNHLALDGAKVDN
jgi:hypothetical protein